MTKLFPGSTCYVIEVYIDQPGRGGEPRFKGYVRNPSADSQCDVPAPVPLTRKGPPQITPFLAVARQFPTETLADAYMHSLPWVGVTMKVKRVEDVLLRLSE